MPARSGYTLPVFACAAAVAALQHLKQSLAPKSVTLDLISPPQSAEIPIEQVAKLGENCALAIARSDPGDNLDLTRDTPIWAMVELQQCQRDSPEEQVEIRGGEGLGRQENAGGKAAIYRYARQVLTENLQRGLTQTERVVVTIILPEGRQLADRTSNAAFGVLEGLSLLGTTGISQPLSAPEQLQAYLEELKEKAARFEELTFCIGENSLDLAQQWGIKRDRILKTANWLGPMFVAAGTHQVQSILLIGYHGKAIKLAGGIFHTHHHLADARLEILTAHCANLGLPTAVLQQVFSSATTEDALQLLRKLDSPELSIVSRVYGAIVESIDARASDYILKHSEQRVRVGSAIFDRDRNIIAKSQIGTALFSKMC
ncbi:cobalt-precorrin-5B (C(1))-methyltransferase CbiD [Oscillatoria sp. FACHB-1406]|uniref:cobalt-precorrin-5B (C(1))-methyltransferase CbiD n=1 Tax=Oscillatoria sp. FACHB-1406 TaxID=2692846 RepID=UPI001684A01F|nr:cobalt-precorrin-5B (C(1))-methyltransferase CbiD [Oscillatoria sp. FACHB-1406]MBD2576637.1 cobalt-precorrin-5B (C(1))-methyltransferase [Oscillatoria sp. FACHB-1406]